MAADALFSAAATGQFPSSSLAHRLPPAIGIRIVAVITAPAPPGSIAASYEHKEHELFRLFAALSILQSAHLLKRLSNPLDGDTLAVAFARLVVDRRLRLLRFLGDARRRAALAGRDR